MQEQSPENPLLCPQCARGKLSLVLLNLEGESAFVCMGSNEFASHAYTASLRPVKDVSTSSSKCCDWRRIPQQTDERPSTTRFVPAREADPPLSNSQIAACTSNTYSVAAADLSCFDCPSQSTTAEPQSRFQFKPIQGPFCLFPFDVQDTETLQHLQLDDFLCTKFEDPHDKAASLLDKLQKISKNKSKRFKKSNFVIPTPKIKRKGSYDIFSSRCTTKSE